MHYKNYLTHKKAFSMLTRKIMTKKKKQLRNSQEHVEPGQWKETKAAFTAYCKEDVRDWVPALPPTGLGTEQAPLWQQQAPAQPATPAQLFLDRGSWRSPGAKRDELCSHSDLFSPAGASYLPVHISVLGHTDLRATSHPASVLSNVGPHRTGYKGYLVRLWPNIMIT